MLLAFCCRCHCARVIVANVFVNTPPTIACPSTQLTKTCTGIQTTVSFSIPASDADGHQISVTCTSPGAALSPTACSSGYNSFCFSGSFAVGVHSVTCTADDHHGGTTSCNFKINVLPVAPEVARGGAAVVVIGC